MLNRPSHTLSRTRLKIVGGLNLTKIEDKLTEQYDQIKAKKFFSFGKIRDAHSKKRTNYLVHDLAGYYRAQAFKDKAKDLNIRLLPLPPYSPNLNPIERLWKVMNEEVRNN